MLDQLKQEPLNFRRTGDCLTLFHKAANSRIALDTEGYLIPATKVVESKTAQEFMATLAQVQLAKHLM